MYKIDDIIKLDLSDKKQYAIAKEILDRYILNESEKEGLLNNLKNKLSNDNLNNNCELTYLNMEDLDIPLLTMFANSVKFVSSEDNTTQILTLGFVVSNDLTNNLLAASFALDEYVITEGIKMTIKEAIINLGLSEEEFNAIPRLTKEEFYDLI